MLLVAAMVNRKTNKVKVVKLKNWIFWTCAWFSLISMVFMIGYLFVDFCFLAVLMPTGKDWKPDWSKPISMVASFVGLGILWVANEIMLKKVPFDAEKINATYRMPKKHHFHWKRRAKVRVVEPSQIEVVEVEPQAPKKQKARKKS
jgi:phosphoglycerol transferase MdoB-like AlkP superfamily enzyme